METYNSVLAAFRRTFLIALGILIFLAFATPHIIRFIVNISHNILSRIDKIIDLVDNPPKMSDYQEAFDDDDDDYGVLGSVFLRSDPLYMDIALNAADKVARVWGKEVDELTGQSLNPNLDEFGVPVEDT